MVKKYINQGYREMLSWLLLLVELVFVGGYQVTQVVDGIQIFIIASIISLLLGLILLLLKRKSIALGIIAVFNLIIILNMFLVINSGNLGNKLIVEGSCLDICIGNGILYYFMALILCLILTFSVIIFYISNRKTK
jgi:hypothetical protein